MSGGAKHRSPLGGDHDGEHENSERWLLTYADMITLLVAFFIMLYSMSVMSLAKFQKLAVSVRSGFNGDAKGGGGPSIVDKGQVNALQSAANADGMQETAKAIAPLVAIGESKNEPFPQQEENFKEMKKAVDELKKEPGLGNAIKLKKLGNGYAVLMIGDGVFFGTDSSELSPEARKALSALAGAVNKTTGKVSVEGYTEKLAEGSKFPTRWHLSSERALNVVRFFATDGQVDPTRLSATGFGERKAGETPEDGDYVRILVRH